MADDLFEAFSMLSKEIAALSQVQAMFMGLLVYYGSVTTDRMIDVLENMDLDGKSTQGTMAVEVTLAVMRAVAQGAPDEPDQMPEWLRGVIDGGKTEEPEC